MYSAGRERFDSELTFCLLIRGIEACVGPKRYCSCMKISNNIVVKIILFSIILWNKVKFSYSL